MISWVWLSRSSANWNPSGPMPCAMIRKASCTASSALSWSHSSRVTLAGQRVAVAARQPSSSLDKARAKYADMVLVLCGGPGVENIAASWVEKNGVHQIVCKSDWDRQGRAAPFRTG